MLCSLVILAAHQNLTALTELGNCYRTGLGVAKDAQEAARLYRLAVDQHDPHAQYHLAFCFFDGAGVERNVQEEICLNRAAALQGHGCALHVISNCYSDGRGVVRNKLMAACFCRLAIELEDEHTEGNLNHLKLSEVWAIQSVLV